MVSILLNLIGERYLIDQMDIGDLSTLKTSVMNFSIQAYKVIGLGHVSVMCDEDVLGLMKMDTLIVNPYEIDLPLLSYDRIYTPTDDTLIFELYDTVVGFYSEDNLISIKSEYQDIPDRDTRTQWYDTIKLSSSISKNGRSDQQSRIDELTVRFFKAYLSSASKVGSISKRLQKTRDYVEGLLKHGGPSTDVFVKEFGIQKTARLYRTILFGTE